MNDFRILVTGSREFGSEIIIRTALRRAAIDARGRRIVVVHGDAPGADRAADKIARLEGWTVEPHHANWRKYGKRAGVIRNAEMVDAGADVCLAFFQYGAANIGTTDCSDRAKAAGIPVSRSECWEVAPDLGPPPVRHGL